MNKWIYFIFLFTSISQFTYAKKDTIFTAKNILYIELVGIGGCGSLNYERILISKKIFMFSIRSGISAYHLKDYLNKFNPDILIPLSIYNCFGKNHKIELGLGMTYINTVHTDFTDYKVMRINDYYTNFNIGYRYQKTKDGFSFRLAYTPIILNNKYKNWAGISMGYTF